MLQCVCLCSEVRVCDKLNCFREFNVGACVFCVDKEGKMCVKVCVCV